MFRKRVVQLLVAKEEGIVKMVDGLACEVIGIGTIMITEKDGTVLLWRQSGMFRMHTTI